MKYVVRFAPWAVLALVGCGGSAFSSGVGPSDGSVDPDGATPPADASPGDASSDGSVASDGANPGDAADGATPPVDAAPDGSGCVTSTVRFELHAQSGQSFCVGGNGPSCSVDWVTVLAAGGGASLPIEAPCATQCGACVPQACPALCAAPSQLPAGGVTRTWDGTYYAPGTCGVGLSCVTPTCAAPGHYVARMCGYAKTGPDASVGACMGASMPTCADVAFDWPPAQDGAVVSGTLLGPAPGNTCCPAGYDLHACTFDDGGAGQACHNPAMGCASSTICGQGCDTVVMGRCANGG